MATWRFRVTDDHNPWFRAIEVDADDEPQATRRAEQMLFARRGVHGWHLEDGVPRPEGADVTIALEPQS